MSNQRPGSYRHVCRQCIDFHAHFLHPEVLRESIRHSVTTNFGKMDRALDSEPFKKMLNPELQIEDMEARGVDKHLISSADVIQGRSWATPQEELRLARLVNDQAQDWVTRFPDRFIGSFVVPLGDVELALREFERCAAMGLKVMNIASQYRGDYLGHARFDELWAAARQAEIVTFIHPDGVHDPWFQDYAMWNSIGQSIEEVRCMSSLIYEGVLERHKGLKIVISHGGGYMPHYMGRLDRNAIEKPATARNLSKMPSAYLRDFHYDSCVFDPRTLASLVNIVGADRIVLGGDYPVAEWDAVGFLDKVEGMTDRQKASIAGETANSLLGAVPAELA
jgi:aminocarboxymuconate-semialdehyde decarboxylase